MAVSLCKVNCCLEGAFVNWNWLFARILSEFLLLECNFPNPATFKGKLPFFPHFPCEKECYYSQSMTKSGWDGWPEAPPIRPPQRQCRSAVLRGLVRPHPSQRFQLHHLCSGLRLWQPFWSYECKLAFESPFAGGTLRQVTVGSSLGYYTCSGAIHIWRPHWVRGRGVPQKQTKADEGGVRPIWTSYSETTDKRHFSQISSSNRV